MYLNSFHLPVLHNVRVDKVDNYVNVRKVNKYIVYYR